MTAERLSDRMSQSSYAITRVWADDVRALEAALEESERLRKHWHSHAAGVSKRSQDSRFMHRRAQSAESRAIKAERQVAALTARLDGAIREMDAKRVEAWARIEHEHCGSVIDRVRRICATDYDAAYDLARDVLAALPDAPIPPVALEASDGGARMLDKDDADCGACEGAGRRWQYDPCAASLYSRPICGQCRGSGKRPKEPRTIDGPSMRIGETVTLRPGDTLVTGGIPVINDYEARTDRMLAERDANATTSTKRTNGGNVRTALACQPGHELEAIAALVSAKEAYRTQRDEQMGVVDRLDALLARIRIRCEGPDSLASYDVLEMLDEAEGQ